MTGIELFSYAACPFAQRVRMVLIEKDIRFDLVEIDLANRPAWFAEVSPYGKVPVLRHAGRIVWESAIINQYLDEAFPSPPLLPADAYRRALARIWMDYCDNRLLPAVHKLMQPGQTAADTAAQRERLAGVLRFMDAEGLCRLGDGPYWLGATPTLVDFQFLPFFERFGVYEELGGAEWPAECTRLRAWYDAMSERRSSIETRHTLDFHLDQQRRLRALQAAAGHPGNR